MGHRFEVYTDETTAQDIIQISESFGVDAQIVGRVEATDGIAKVSICGPHGTFVYT